MTSPAPERLGGAAGARATAWADRVSGLDLARAAALIGMFAAHVADSGTRAGDYEGWRWLWIADGRPSALFAILAGVTISLMVARDPHGARHTAARIAVRGALLMGAGYALTTLGTPIDVILTNLGLMFVVVLPTLTWSTRTLAITGAAVMVVGALVWPEIAGTWDGVPVVEKFASANYPAVAWTGYVLAGMALGRLDLRQLDLRRASAAPTLLAGGAVAALLAYGAGAACGGALPWEVAWATSAQGPRWASTGPHTNTVFEMAGNTGVACMVIGACLLIARGRVRRVLLPALAFGSMSLTMYTAHLVVITVVGDQIVWQPSNVAFVAMTLALMAAATVWRATVGVGPLERGMTWASSQVARLVLRRRSSVNPA